MRSIILTAGRGDRLRPITGNRPKCLATVGGCAIRERQRRALRACGVSRITGYRSDDVRRMSGPSVEFGRNPRSAATNSLYSLWLARELEELDRLVAAGAIKDWAPSAFAGFCRRRPVHVVDHRGFPWIEIDSPNDSWRACTHIAPVLDDAVPGAGTAVRRAADHV